METLKIQTGKSILTDPERKVVYFPHPFPILFAFSTTKAGNMSLNLGEEAEVEKNKREFLKILGIQREGLVEMVPLHGNIIREIIEKDRGFRVLGDGFVTKTLLPLAFCPADCFPMILVDKKKKFLGLFHLGRKNVFEGMVYYALRFFTSAFELDPKDIIVGIGPGIHSCCYRGLGLVKEAIRRGFRKFVSFKRLSLDLNQIIWDQLHQFKVGTIVDINLCTCCSRFEDGEFIFFSHRRALKLKEREGRFIALAKL